jgi:hypothetical protein
MPGGVSIDIKGVDPAVSAWASSASGLKYLTGHAIGHKVLQSLTLGNTIDEWPVQSMRLQSCSGEQAAVVRERLSGVDIPRATRSGSKRQHPGA